MTDDLDCDLCFSIIKKVPQGTTSMWCARKVVIPKKNGDPQDIVNLQELNNATLRETNNTLSPVDTVSTVPTKARKTVLDAWNGYHSLALHEITKKSMTFIAEWDRYQYYPALMGFPVLSDAYTRQFLT